MDTRNIILCINCNNDRNSDSNMVSNIEGYPYIGGYADKIDMEDAEMYVEMAIKNNYETIHINHKANGLGPKHIFNYYELRIRVNHDTKSDSWEITPETREYLINKYKDKIKVY